MTDYAVNRGLRIAYDAAGVGAEVVVLLHGLAQRGMDWAAPGYVAGLADKFRVICIDSLGHGESDSPDDCSLYSRPQRAGDVLAVLDAIGVERAHVVGYSMGGWLASAVLVHAPDRLRSVCFGGWDPVHGLDGVRPIVRSQFGVELDFEMLLSAVREQYPQFTEWITPEREPALRCCWAAVEDLDGVEQALEISPVPMLFWDGQMDPHHDGSRAMAARLPRAEFLKTPGDHGTAFYEDNLRRSLVCGELLDASHQR
jgi:pimeloyl-ACP methyl ester carboxylesterase